MVEHFDSDVLPSTFSFVPVIQDTQYDKHITAGFESEFAGAKYAASSLGHTLKFSIGGKEFTGKIISGYLSENTNTLNGFIYTNSLIYSYGVKDRLGMAFSGEKIIGFIW